MPAEENKSTPSPDGSSDEAIGTGDSGASKPSPLGHERGKAENEDYLDPIESNPYEFGLDVAGRPINADPHSVDSGGVRDDTEGDGDAASEGALGEVADDSDADGELAVDGELVGERDAPVELGGVAGDTDGDDGISDIDFVDTDDDEFPEELGRPIRLPTPEADEERSLEDMDDDYLFSNQGKKGTFIRRSVRGWPILAVGHRLLDHLVRDCLFASQFRDKRVVKFHEYTKKPPSWMEDLIPHITAPADRKAAINFLVLQYQHKYRLSQYLPENADQYEADFEADDPDPHNDPVMRHQLIQGSKVWDCMPNTVLVKRSAIVNRSRKHSEVCGLKRLCPWCFSRAVLRLYERLLPVVVGDDRWKYLVLGKVDPFDEPFGGVTGYDAHADGYAAYGPNRESVRGHTGRYFGIDGERLRYTRKLLVRLLQDEAASLGLVDGLITNQVGSGQGKTGRRSFRHDVAFLGGVGEADYHELKDFLFEGGHALTVGNFTAPIHWVMIPATEQGLRAFLAGTAWGFVPDDLEYPAYMQNIHNGVQGALSWEPTYLMDDQLWPTYMRATEKLPIYEPIGGWKERLGNAKKAIKKNKLDFRGTMERGYQRIREARNPPPQQKGNRARKDQAKSEFDRFLAVAREVWPAILATPHQRTGSPPRKKLLLEELQARGLGKPSDMILRKLMKALKS